MLRLTRKQWRMAPHVKGLFSIFTIVSSLANFLASGFQRCRTTRSIGIDSMPRALQTSSSATAWVVQSGTSERRGVGDSTRGRSSAGKRFDASVLTLAVARRILEGGGTAGRGA